MHVTHANKKYTYEIFYLRKHKGRNSLSGGYNIKTDPKEVVRKVLCWTELIVISGGSFVSPFVCLPVPL